MSQILHKEFDFTHPGGFPLTQERMQYMQEATGEAITALIAAGGNPAGPIIISGMRKTEPVTGTFAVSSGWFIYQGRMVKFTGGSVTPGADVLVVQITQNTTDLLYYDTSTPPAQLSTTAVLAAHSSATPTATQFPFALATEWATGVGLQQRDEDWEMFTFSDVYGTTTSGNIRYKRNRLTNTVHIKGDIYVGAPHSAFGLGGTEVPLAFGYLGYVPAGMLANEKIHIPNCVAHPTDPLFPMTTFSGTQYFNSWKIEMDSTGAFYTNIVRPHASIPNYAVYINHILSLD